MNKKIIIGSAVVIFSMLIFINVYIYMNDKTVMEHLDNSESNTQAIVAIDSFRTNINKLAQNQKLYILTAKEEYKSKYYQEINLIYSNIKEMRANEVISEQEEKDLVQAIQNYEKLNDTQIDLMNGDKISEELENKILKSNDEQIAILNKLEESITSTKQSLSETNSNISANSEIQKKGIQAISTLMTGITSISAYFVKNNLSKSNKEIGKIVDCISEISKDGDAENKENKKEIKEVEVTSNDSCLEKRMDDIIRYEKLLEGIKLISKQRDSVQYKLQEFDKNISKIEICILKLKSKLENIDDNYAEINKDVFEDIEKELISIKMLFQALPIYNEVMGHILDSLEEQQ